MTRSNAALDLEPSPINVAPTEGDASFGEDPLGAMFDVNSQDSEEEGLDCKGHEVGAVLEAFVGDVLEETREGCIRK